MSDRVWILAAVCNGDFIEQLPCTKLNPEALDFFSFFISFSYFRKGLAIIKLLLYWTSLRLYKSELNKSFCEKI